MTFREFWLRCDCHSAEHSMLLSFDPEEEEFPCISAQPHLTKQGFWRRLKYLFGYQSRYGAFAELVLSEKQIADLEDFLSEFRNGASGMEAEREGER